METNKTKQKTPSSYFSSPNKTIACFSMEKRDTVTKVIKKSPLQDN
jgi:hypothetical protein